jgi:dihydrofolate synthase/folylpolyglutamate synthase
MYHTLSDWLGYIETLHPKAIALGLDRVREVGEKLQVTHFRCPVITVGGTNGKGSCVAFLQSTLNAAGYQVGSYTSPHLLRFNERICFNGIMVDDAALVEAFQQIEQARAEIPLTYFEFTTLAALWLFQRADLDAIVLEVGLGGRLDAVNIVDADVAVITTVALDHMDWLGDTREAIGYEKAGIFRAGRPAVCGDFDPPATLLQAAAECGAQLYCVGRGFGYELDLKADVLAAAPSLRASRFCERGDPENPLGSDKGCSDWSWHCGTTIYQNLPSPHLPLQNAVTALMALHCLSERLPVSRKAIEQGLQQAKLPGRFQEFHQPRWIILDVAHNPASAQLLAERLVSQPCGGKTYAVASMLGDKDILSSLQPLLPCVDQWFVGGLDVPRGVPAETIANYLQKLGVTAYHTHHTIPAAFDHALQVSQPLDRIVVFGSFHTVAAVLATLEN